MLAIRIFCLLCVALLLLAAPAAAQPRGPNARAGAPGNGPMGGPPGGGPGGPGPGGTQRPVPPYAGPPWIDVHVHFRGGGSYADAAAQLVAAMDRAGMRLALLMPPPFPSGGTRQRGTYDAAELIAVARAYAGRIGWLAGGGSLNPIIQDTPADKVTPSIKTEFAAQAEKLLDQGALGFGEMAVLHLSHTNGHPFEQVSADHPLLLLLADIAARRGKLLDIHMDLVEHAAALPVRFVSPPNPGSLKPNLPALERLLAHNPNTKIVLAHAGWDVTGQWTAEVTRGLLQRHANLFMSVKAMPGQTPAHMPIGQQGINPDWLALLNEFPDRFVIGTDSFFAAPDAPLPPIWLPGPTEALLSRLPPPLAEALAHGNAERIYGVKPN